MVLLWGYYPVVESILRVINDSRSIIDDHTLCTPEWEIGKNIPRLYNMPIGSTKDNCYIAKECAIMVVQKPYELSNIINN